MKIIKNLSLLFLAIILFTSCGNKNSNTQNKAVDVIKKEKSAKYLQKVQKLGLRATTEKDSIQNAIVLLDSAIMLDSTNSKAFLLKIRYQTWLGEYESALETLKTLERNKSQSPEFKAMEGLLYLLKENSKSAKIALKKSVELWNSRLDTISKNNDWSLLGALMGKAGSLKLLGKEKQANNIYRRILTDSIFDKTKYKELKKTIDSLFLNQNKKEFYDYLVRGLKKE